MQATSLIEISKPRRKCTRRPNAPRVWMTFQQALNRLLKYLSGPRDGIGNSYELKNRGNTMFVILLFEGVKKAGSHVASGSLGKNPGLN